MSRIFSLKVNYPENIQSPRAKTFYWLFRQLYTRSVGQGQVIGRFTNMIPEFGIAILLIERFTSVRFIWWSVILVGVGAFIIAWLIGRIWMHFSFDRIDSQVSSERNILMDEIHKDIVKIRERL